ncbi:MAG: hypothetical protein KOO69_03370, partial [Victivallales bacterium]|nr:hypothetical protein [Victivallales bacterium]
MRFIFYFILFCFVFYRADAAQMNIATFLEKNKSAVWTTSPKNFQKKNGSKSIYRWNSVQKKSLHYAANRTKSALYFLDWRITEADFNFENKQLNSMSINIYNKSCLTNKSLAKNKNVFFKFLKKIRRSLNTFCKKNHSKPSVKLINSARCQSCFWNTPNAYIVLKWSFAGATKYNFTAHYATVYIYKNKQVFNEKSRSKAVITNISDLKARIKIDTNGDRHLAIPMVDQGKRGYCVVACAERILKYYKVNVDQHMMP